MGKKNLVSVTDFSCDEILRIMELAAQFEGRSAPAGFGGQGDRFAFFRAVDPHEAQLRERDQPSGGAG